MKIFVIGFNKTATCSINGLLKKLGINSVHTTVPVLKIIRRYQAFTDGIHFKFKEYYKRYPNAKFILNTRPIAKWLISRYKHGKYHNFTKCWCWPISNEKTNQWITDRENHFKNVLEFFKDKPNQLLVINIQKNGWERVMASFIGKNPNRYRNISTRRNGRPDRKLGNKINAIRKNVSECLKKREYNPDDLLAKNIDITQYKYPTYL